MFINDVTVTSFINITHSWYSELNSLQNVYFGLFIFGKLTEWRCFVTYLSNDPCITCVRWIACGNVCIDGIICSLLKAEMSHPYVAACSIDVRLTTSVFILVGYSRCIFGVLVIRCISLVPNVCHFSEECTPRVGSGVVRIDPLHFLAGCRTRQLNQV